MAFEPRHHVADSATTDRDIVCESCGALFVYSVRDQEFAARMGWHLPPRRCKACRETRQRERKLRAEQEATGAERTCRDCKEPFIVTTEEAKWYADPARRWELPKRCPDCRRQRRQERNS